MKDPVRTEWRRLLARLRRQGLAETTTYVSGLVETGDYPLTYPYRFIEYLLKHGEYAAAGKLLGILKRTRQNHHRQALRQLALVYR